MNARSVSAASPTRTSSSVEGGFPSLYSQFGGDEVSVVSSCSQPGRWSSGAAESYTSVRGSAEPGDFFALGRSLGGIGREPADCARRQVADAALRSLNDGTARSFGEAFEMFQEERPGWRHELAEAPPRTAPGVHVFDVPPSDVAAVSARSSEISRGMHRMGGDF